MKTKTREGAIHPPCTSRDRNIPELVGCIKVVVEEVVANADGLRTVITVVKALRKDKKNVQLFVYELRLLINQVNLLRKL